jgi:hypothetical protein
MSVVDSTGHHAQGETLLPPPLSERERVDEDAPSVAPLLHSLPASALFDMLVELGRTVPGAAALIRLRAAVC